MIRTLFLCLLLLLIVSTVRATASDSTAQNVWLEEDNLRKAEGPISNFNSMSTTRQGSAALAGETSLTQSVEPTENAAAATVPLTQEAMAACPVSQPNVDIPPQSHLAYYIGRSGYQNPEGNLFTIIGQRVIIYPGGPGEIHPDGALSQKWWFYRRVAGELTIVGRRLDAPAPPLQAHIPEGYGDSGFQATSLIFPTEGCWEVTARVGDAELTFVTLVVKLAFAPARAAWLPAGLTGIETDLSDRANSVRSIYGYTDGREGELVVETTKVRERVRERSGGIGRQPSLIRGSRVCVQGAWGEEQRRWDYEAEAALLEWRVDDLRIRYIQRGLGLSCADLMLVAVGVPPPAASTESPVPTPAPLTKAAVRSCPVTIPNNRTPPGMDPHPVGRIHGNGTLWVTLWPGGKVLVQSERAGPLGMKFPWWRVVEGQLTIQGTRLDAPAPPLRAQILPGYEHTHFQATRLIFPSEGCWQVTARVGDAGLTFVTLVVQVPFEYAQARWVPEGLFWKDTDVTGLPWSIRLLYRVPDGARAGELVIETSQEVVKETEAYPETAVEQVTVNGHPAICVRGGWGERGQWRAGAVMGALEWEADGLYYRISQTGLGLGCEDLVRIAAGPRR